jgi:hypothetical protein
VGLRVESIREKSELLEDEPENGGDDGDVKKNREPLRRAEPIRVVCLAFILSFAASPGSVKGTSNLLSVAGDLAGFAPA